MGAWGGRRVIKTSIIQRKRVTGGNTTARRNQGCTGLTCWGNW